MQGACFVPIYEVVNKNGDVVKRYFEEELAQTHAKPCRSLGHAVRTVVAEIQYSGDETLEEAV